MLSVIEKFLFQQFPKMPQYVRVPTYLAMLLLFGYLLLIPKFIDGHLKIFVPTANAMKDYRGGQLRMAIEGRTYKFSANEDGYWSIPVVSNLPSSVVFEVYDKDKDEWRKVKLSVLQVWKKGPYEIELYDKPPFVQLVADNTNDFTISHLSYVVNYLSALFTNQATAGTLYLPANMSSSLSENEKQAVQEKVFRILSRAVNKQAGEISMSFHFIGQGAPSYKEKMVIIPELEQAFSISIPDEHWQSFETVGQLVDYIEKRIIIERSSGNQNSKVRKDWQDIKDSFPTRSRPVYKY